MQMITIEPSLWCLIMRSCFSAHCPVLSRPALRRRSSRNGMQLNSLKASNLNGGVGPRPWSSEDLPRGIGVHSQAQKLLQSWCFSVQLGSHSPSFRNIFLIRSHPQTNQSRHFETQTFVLWNSSCQPEWRKPRPNGVPVWWWSLSLLTSSSLGVLRLLMSPKYQLGNSDRVTVKVNASFSGVLWSTVTEQASVSTQARALFCAEDKEYAQSSKEKGMTPTYSVLPANKSYGYETSQLSIPERWLIFGPREKGVNSTWRRKMGTLCRA